MNIRYKTTTTKCNSFFFQYATKIRKGEALHLHDVWNILTLHWTCSRIDALPFLYNSSAFLLSFLCIVWISFCPRTSSLEPFWLFYDLIASYYTKGKWQWRKGYLFCFESYHFDKKMFLYICLFFSFWSEEFT